MPHNTLNPKPFLDSLLTRAEIATSGYPTDIRGYREDYIFHTLLVFQGESGSETTIRDQVGTSVDAPLSLARY